MREKQQKQYLPERKEANIKGDQRRSSKNSKGLVNQSSPCTCE